MSKFNGVRQGQWCCAGHRHPESTGEYTTTSGNKNWGLCFVINLWKGFSYPSLLRGFLRDPPFVQGLVTLFPSRNTIQRSPCHATCKNCYDTPLCIHICIHIHIYMYKCVHFFGTPFKEVFVTPCAKKVLSRRFVYVYVIIYTYACVCTLSAQHVKKFVPCHV